MSIAFPVAEFGISDHATPAIAAKLEKCSPRRLGAIVGRPLAEFWRNRLRDLGPNKRGWPTTRFYERAARSVTHIPNDQGVTLRADHQGLRQRWQGGPITPQKADALAIPISPVSYGRKPSEFPGLFLLKTRKGAYLVQRGESFSAAGSVRAAPRLRGNADRRLQAALNFLFKLSRGVVQAGDPRVVPTNDEFAEVAMAVITEAVK